MDTALREQLMLEGGDEKEPPIREEHLLGKYPWCTYGAAPMTEFAYVRRKVGFYFAQLPRLTH